jgi:cyclase
MSEKKSINNTANSKIHSMSQWRCITATGATYTRYEEIPHFPEGLYEIGNQLYAWMVPNGSWGESNAGLIIGDGEALLVDTLWDVGYTYEMLQTMKPVLADVPLKYVVNTHADGDHFWGNELVANAEIITSEAAYEEMLTTLPKSLILLRKVGCFLSAARVLKADQVGHWFQTMMAPYDFARVNHTPARRKFTGELLLNVGGRAVKLIEVGPAHTRGDLLVYVPDAKVLYSGDIVFNASTPVMWAGPVENYLAALDRILAMEVETVVPGHGAITDKEGVRQVKAYWEYVAAEIRKRYEAGLPVEAAARDVVLSAEFTRRPFATWNSPERIMVNAHTLYRNFQGRTGHPKVPELLNIMRKQALLAQELPQAQPLIMRKGNAG